MCKFTNAANAYLMMPTVANLIALTDNALPLLHPVRSVAAPAKSRWAKVHDACGFTGQFTRLRVTIDRRLSDAEVDRAAQCIGYAFKETLCGEPLVVTNILRSYDAQQTVLICEYDSSLSARSLPDVGFALYQAARYVQEGSPIRLTNRSGPKTAGTRLVDGIGIVDVTFATR